MSKAPEATDERVPLHWNSLSDVYDFIVRYLGGTDIVKNLP